MGKGKNIPIVEFFGLPGAGKTTVCDELIDKYKSAEGKVYDRSQYKFWVEKRSRICKTFFLIKQPRWIITSIILFISTSYLKDSLKKEYLRRILTFVKSPIYINEFINRTDCKLVILDQSSIQAFWSIWVGRKKPNPLTIKQIIENLQKFLSVYYIYADIETIEVVNRIKNRELGTSRYDNKFKDKMVTKCNLKYEEELMIQLKEILGKSENNMLVINTEGKPRKTSKEIYYWLEQKINL